MNLMFLAMLVLPVLAAVALGFMSKASYKSVFTVSCVCVLLTAALALYFVFGGAFTVFSPITFTERLVLCFQLDGLGRIFSAILAFLWPLTTLYAFAYMKSEERAAGFFAFFTLSFTASLGIAFAGNIFTMYVFYEMLTLATFPLVLHPMTHEAAKATNRYVIFSLGGAAFGFAAMIFLLTHGGDGLFLPGGMALELSEDDAHLLFFLFGFVGFGVKAAVFPTHLWLPKATVAPTPVTALLHAVAVVKAGAFALIRLAWYCFGPDALRGTWAHTVTLCLCIFTVLFGSYMAVREQNWKRRLAYSTVSNISYILFGAFLLTKDGLDAGLFHLVNHSVIKILAFFCAGAVLKKTSYTKVSQLDDVAGAMPGTAICFAISALSLTGIPPFGGFVSKWKLLTAGIAQGSALGFAGSVVLIVSALFTALYMLGPAVKLCFPKKKGEKNDASWWMLAPMGLLALLCLALGLFAQPILNLIHAIIFG